LNLHAFLLDQDGRIRDHGRIDHLSNPGFATIDDLRNRLEVALAAGEIDISRRR
jgi:hypothetical protein